MNKMRILSILMVAVMAVALAACGGDSGTGVTSMSNSDLLKKAAQSMKDAKSYHLDMDGTSGTTTFKLAGDFDVANKKTKLDIDSAGQKISLITIADKSYLSTDGGQNFTDAGAMGDSLTSGFSTFTNMWNSFDASKTPSNDVLKDGTPATDTIDGSSCKHMTAAAKDLGTMSGGSTSVDGNVDLWAAGDGTRVCQMKVKGSSSGTGADVTIKWSKLNETFTIETPKTAAPLPLV